MLDAEDLAWGDLVAVSRRSSPACAPTSGAPICARTTAGCSTTSGTAARSIVQYNKFEFNEAQYGPYPAKVSVEPRDRRDTRRSRILERGAIRCSTTPNQITDAAWDGWVQERGLYFLGERDSRYRDLVALEDPFPNNTGREARRARRRAVRQGPMGVRRPRPVARAAGRRRRRVSAARQSDQLQMTIQTETSDAGTLSRSSAGPTACLGRVGRRRRPAGATAARTLARAGVTVRLLDRSKFPRNKPCGGGISLRRPEAVSVSRAGAGADRDPHGVAAPPRGARRRFDRRSSRTSRRR